MRQLYEMANTCYNVKGIEYKKEKKRSERVERQRVLVYRNKK